MSDVPPGVGIEPGSKDLKSKGEDSLEKLMEVVDDVGSEDDEYESEPPGLHTEPPGLTSKSGSMDSSVDTFGIPPGITNQTKDEDKYDEEDDDEGITMSENGYKNGHEDEDDVVVMSVDPIYPPPASSSRTDQDDDTEPLPPSNEPTPLEPSPGTPADFIQKHKADTKIPIESSVHVQHSPSEPSTRIQRDHGISVHSHNIENALRGRLEKMEAAHEDSKKTIKNSDERIQMLNQIHAREIETMLQRMEKIKSENKEKEERMERKFEAAQAYSAKLMRHINENMSPAEKADERYGLEKQVIELKQHVDILKHKLLTRAKRERYQVEEEEDDDEEEEEPEKFVVESVDPLYPPSRKKLERRIEDLTKSLREAETRITKQSLVIRGLQDHLRAFASSSSSNNGTIVVKPRQQQSALVKITQQQNKKYNNQIIVHPSDTSLAEIDKDTESLAKFCTKMMRSRRQIEVGTRTITNHQIVTAKTHNKHVSFPPVLSHEGLGQRTPLPDSKTRREVMNSVLDFNDEFGPRLSEDEVREIVSRSTMGFVNEVFEEEEKEKRPRRTQRRLVEKKSKRPSRKWHYTNAHW